MEGEEDVGCVTQVPMAPVTVLSHAKSSRSLSWYALWPHPILGRPLDSSPEQNRYLPMIYMIWLIVCTYPEYRSNPTYSNPSTIASESWSYTYEVGIRRFFEAFSACLTPVGRCASKPQANDERILILTSHGLLNHSIVG